MRMKSLTDLMEDELKDLLSAENQLLKMLPKMAKKASSIQLKNAFTCHLMETEGHVNRLKQIAKILEIDLDGKQCQAMEGLIKQGGEALEVDGPPAVIDSALIGVVRGVEQYEMAAYRSTRGMAMQLGNDRVAKLLEETANEEEAADKKLKAIARNEVFPQGAAASDSEEGEEEDRRAKSTPAGSAK